MRILELGFSSLLKLHVVVSKQESNWPRGSKKAAIECKENRQAI